MLLKQIQYFMAVARCRHFTQAAEQLFVSQSALSQQITKLENDMGVKLINRLSHPVSLTAAGEDFARCAADILAALDTLEQKMQSHRPNANSTLRIGMITGLGRIPLAEILADFNTVHSEIRLSLVNHLSKELCQMLTAGLLDVAIFAAPDNIGHYDFEYLTLQHEPFVAILPARHPSAAQTAINLAAMRDEPFIFPTTDNVSYDIFLAACEKAGFHPRIISNCNKSQQRVHLVQAGLGISLISESGLNSLSNQRGLVSRPLVTPVYKHIVIARQKKTVPDRALQSFWDYVQSYAGGE